MEIFPPVFSRGGLSVGALVFCDRDVGRNRGFWCTNWIPACAGMTVKMGADGRLLGLRRAHIANTPSFRRRPGSRLCSESLDSGLRRNDGRLVCIGWLFRGRVVGLNQRVSRACRENNVISSDLVVRVDHAWAARNRVSACRFVRRSWHCRCVPCDCVRPAFPARWLHRQSILAQRRCADWL